MAREPMSLVQPRKTRSKKMDCSLLIWEWNLSALEVAHATASEVAPTTEGVPKKSMEPRAYFLIDGSPTVGGA
jgi:hypothetical protein